MVDQIVITEKTSQAKDVRAAIGSRYGMVLPAEGHLLELLEPEDVVPEWKRWSTVLLRPEELYGTLNRPEFAEGVCVQMLRSFLIFVQAFIECFLCFLGRDVADGTVQSF